MGRGASGPRQSDTLKDHLRLPTNSEIARVKGNTLNNLGSVCRGWGQYDKTVEYYDKSLAIGRDLKDRQGRGRSPNNWASLCASGDYDAALTNFSEALEIYEKIGVSTDRPNDLIGNLYLDRGDVSNAESFVKEAGYVSSLARLQLAKGDYQGAQDYYEKLRTSAEKNRHADNLFTAYTGLAMAYEAIGDDEKAEEHFRKAVNLTEELRSSLPEARQQLL